MRTLNVRMFLTFEFQMEVVFLLASSVFFWGFIETWAAWELVASILLGVAAGWFGSWAYRTERIRFWK